MPLAELAEITMPTRKLKDDVAFFHLLGFQYVAGHQSYPYPWAMLTDGSIYVGLHKESPPERQAALTYFVKDLPATVKELKKKGIAFERIAEEEKIPIHARFNDPDGQPVNLFPYAEGKMPPKPRGKSALNCGKFGEFSLRVKDLERSIEFWTKLGLEATGRYKTPYPWANLKDNNLVLGLHQQDNWSQPTLTYFDDDMPERIRDLKSLGITFSCEDDSVTESPGGQRFFLFRSRK